MLTTRPESRTAFVRACARYLAALHAKPDNWNSADSPIRPDTLNPGPNKAEGDISSGCRGHSASS